MGSPDSVSPNMTSIYAVDHWVSETTQHCLLVLSFSLTAELYPCIRKTRDCGGTGDKSLLHQICESYIVKRRHTNSWVPDSLTSVSREITEHVLSGHISRHVRKKKVTGNSQHGFTKGESCLTHLIAFHDKLIGLADEGDQKMTFTLTLARVLPPSLTELLYPSKDMAERMAEKTI